jgi:transposase
MEEAMAYKIAGIDIHKAVLMVVVVDVEAMEKPGLRRRFGSSASDLQELAGWLQEQGVEEAVMESTAQYWKPVWYELEDRMTCHLAQAFSNQAPRGRKMDFRDAERLVRRLVAKELILSFVPGREQRGWRTMTRMRVQLARDRVRVHNYVEALLEEMRLKISSVLSDLLGASGLRMLRALAQGETDGKRLAALGDARLECSPERLADALTGNSTEPQRALLQMHLERLDLIDEQIQKLNQRIAEAMKPYEDAVVRLSEVTGFGVDSAQQFIAEVGPEAATFPSPQELTSWAGTCPGKEESALQNQSSRSPKGNKYVRRILTEVAQAASKTKGSHYQQVFHRLKPRLGYKQALWALVNRICRVTWVILHRQVRFIEQSPERDAKAQKQRAQTWVRNLRKMGYQVILRPLNPTPLQA